MRLALDEATRSLIARMTAEAAPVESLTPRQARQAQEARRARAVEELVEVDRVAEWTIPGPGGEIPIRVYWPNSAEPLPVVVYFHGGGWVLCDLDSHDAICRALAVGSNCTFVSVGYRLAPEHKFPAAVEDAYAATSWVAEHPARLQCEGQPIAVAGDSAGGNLAAAVTLVAKAEQRPAIAFQMLVYPITNHGFETRSYRENGEGYYLTRAAMQWYWRHYLSGAGEGESPYASPLRAENVTGLPPALVITAEFDPLRDEGEAYGRRLADAGVPVTIRRFDGMFHGFFGRASLLEPARRAQELATGALRLALHEPSRQQPAG